MEASQSVYRDIKLKEVARKVSEGISSTADETGAKNRGSTRRTMGFDSVLNCLRMIDTKDIMMERAIDLVNRGLAEEHSDPGTKTQLVPSIGMLAKEIDSKTNDYGMLILYLPDLEGALKRLGMRYYRR